MEISDRTKNYLEMLEKNFNKSDFCNFIKDLLNLDSENIVNGFEKRATSEQYKNYIDTSCLYAQYEDKRRRKIGVLIIKLQSNKNPANARTLQRNYIAHLLEEYSLDACLAAIYSNTDSIWRLSFVKKEITIEVGGKIKTKVSPAKRYSYLFGKDEPNHTAKEQLIDFIENNKEKYSIEELEEKFSVEKVTMDFFETYKEKYLKLKERLEENTEFQSESKRCDFTSEEFTKKLMGQLVFLYFLQKKGWLGVKIVPEVLTIDEFNSIYSKRDTLEKKILDKYYIEYNGNKKIKNSLLEKYKENEQDLEILSTIFVGTKYDEEWGTGEKRFIRKRFIDCVNRNRNFFDDYLEPFFYDGLNHKRTNQYFSVFNCKIPFLNGGLFEPIDNYMWESSNFNLNNEIFGEILDFFDRYNFTMNEEEPLEKDVAVDPEMLGKIFEKLLDVEDRKKNGAFYTPRDIVHYMCQESIANYLVNKVGVKYNEIEEFIKYGEMIRDVDLKSATKTNYLVGETIFKNIIKIDEALKTIKVADPAVGSGAFPLGMLNEIVKLRDIITSYLLIYNREKIFNRVYTEEEITNNKRSIYRMKWETIKNCIYAVDLENSAVDITKLRLWLSIVVDQTQNTEPEPLPNLDCKIMQGNSLIDEYEGIKLIDSKFINELKDRDNIKFNDGGKIKVKGKMVEISDNQIQFGDGQKKVQIDDLINLKKELYGENDRKRKNFILEKIQSARKELLRLNFTGTNKEKSLYELDKSHNKPYFAWMLEFIEVFIENDGFDIVIGNPPYGADIDKQIDLFEKLYPKTSKGYKEIYKYFIDIGINNLVRENGILCYITPNTYLLQPRYKDVRNVMLEYTINRLLNLGEDVFDAEVPTAICLIAKNKECDNNVLIYSDASINSKYCGDINKKIDKSIKQSYFNETNGNIFAFNSQEKKEDELFFEEIVSMKDAGINYQRVKVGLKEKGKSDLSDRLLYSGNQENDDDKEYWKGKDINEFYSLSNTNRYVRTNIELRSNERVILNKDYFEIKPKLLWRQTAPYTIADIDNDGKWFGRSIQAGVINENYTEKFTYEYLCCLLNSNYIRYLYTQNVKETGKVFPQVKLDKLKRIPIKVISKEQQKKYKDYYEKIKLKKMINENAQELLNELNDDIYELYNIPMEKRILINNEIGGNNNE